MTAALIIAIVVIAFLMRANYGARSERNAARARLKQYEEVAAAKIVRNEQETEQHRKHT